MLVLYSITWCQYPEEHGLPFVNESSSDCLL